MHSQRLAVFAVPAVLSLALALACGGGGGDSSSTPAPSASPAPAPAATPQPAPTITISGMAFSPLSLEVTPGAVVTVRDLDGMSHTVTSEAAPNAFTPGSVGGVSFDTGPIVGTAQFTIPANAAVGTTVPYYCRTHLRTMTTPNGEIRIVAAPTTAPTPAPTTAPTPAPTTAPTTSPAGPTGPQY